MEIFIRRELIKKKLISALDYSACNSVTINEDIICVEVLLHDIPEDIDINIITFKSFCEFYDPTQYNFSKFDKLYLCGRSMFGNALGDETCTRLIYTGKIERKRNAIKSGGALWNYF